VTSEIIWSIVGVSVSAIFGVVGIYLTVKSRYSGKITFVNEQTIELFDAIGNSLDKLAVTYNESEVNENLVLLNGAFINSGKFDITPDMVEQPITIKLPDGYKWLTGRVIDSNIKASLAQDNENTISISTGLFRCGEYVRFHALAQLPETDEDDSNSKRFKKALSFEHRIVNTKNIDETETQPKKVSQKALKRRGIPVFILLLIISGIIGFAFYNGSPKVMVYPYSISESITEQVKIKTTNNDLVIIVSMESEFEIEEPFSEFIKKTLGNPTLSKPETNFMFYIMASIQLLLIGVMLATLVFEFYRNRRLLKILGEQ
jgi:hypothetical protein